MVSSLWSFKSMRKTDIKQQKNPLIISFFNKYLLITYCLSDTVAGLGNRVETKKIKAPSCSHKAAILVARSSGNALYLAVM